MGTTASAAGTTAVEAAIGVTPGSARDGEPRTPKEVPEDVPEEPKVEPEVAPEPVPEVVQEEALAEGDHRPYDGDSSPIPWCTSTIFTDTLHGRCNRRGNGGGPRASHPLCAGQQLSG
jgi:hypothetical protein